MRDRRSHVEFKWCCGNDALVAEARAWNADRNSLILWVAILVTACLDGGTQIVILRSCEQLGGTK